MGFESIFEYSVNLSRVHALLSQIYFLKYLHIWKYYQNFTCYKTFIWFIFLFNLYKYYAHDSYPFNLNPKVGYQMVVIYTPITASPNPISAWHLPPTPVDIAELKNHVSDPTVGFGSREEPPGSLSSSVTCSIACMVLHLVFLARFNTWFLLHLFLHFVGANSISLSFFYPLIFSLFSSIIIIACHS